MEIDFWRQSAQLAAYPASRHSVRCYSTTDRNTDASVNTASDSSTSVKNSTYISLSGPMYFSHITFLSFVYFSERLRRLATKTFPDDDMLQTVTSGHRISTKGRIAGADLSLVTM